MEDQSTPIMSTNRKVVAYATNALNDPKLIDAWSKYCSRSNNGNDNNNSDSRIIMIKHGNQRNIKNVQKSMWDHIFSSPPVIIGFVFQFYQMRYRHVEGSCFSPLHDDVCLKYSSPGNENCRNFRMSNNP